MFHKVEHVTLRNANNCSAKRRFLFVKADAELRFLLASAQYERCKVIGSTMLRRNKAHPINTEAQLTQPVPPCRGRREMHVSLQHCNL
jgi:hypothetical protein